MDKSNGVWTCHQHVIPASHIRGFERGVRDERKHRRSLRLSVNEYAPNIAPDGSTEPITILFHHGVGFTKESYEPLFTSIFRNSNHIRAIWSYDIAWHGKSYLLNEDVIGDIPHWNDDARDVLQIVNYFHEKMPAPIVGVAHSVGSSVLMMASLMHPRLFSGIVCVDPVYATGYSPRPLKYHRAILMARRRDRWASKDEARKAFLKSPYYAAFDPEVFELVMEHDLREVTSPDGKTYVTLVTPKAQEVGSMFRPVPANSVKEFAGVSTDRNSFGAELVIPGFHLYELAALQKRMKELVPSIHVIWAANSDIYKIPKYAEFAHKTLGTDKGVYAHSAPRRVTQEVIDGAGHTVPLEKPRELGKAISQWLEHETPLWKQEYEAERGADTFWSSELNPDWMKEISKI
ncbi:alpha/beta-hydrolase [Eremomyces bilateralis CBS 781.70]|uniref:Alpha/beta-hydrolase n=1 Tax=Eremomyces bilateralis CBS 781.70 TaxID=1392243 RepID=A0A6G1FWY8_9PEZI|nr:alpha/beta-hydrolase [Eremomyces bilateralis CBS 781.70]KAF1810303.1 alpha/beta-hydrolase [Eremomyces bilateralis CBS 781.70]